MGAIQIPEFLFSFKKLHEIATKLSAIFLYYVWESCDAPPQKLFGITLYSVVDRKVALRNEDVAMNVLHETQDTEAFDPDTVSWLEDAKGPTKPKAGSVLRGPLPANSHIMTEGKYRSACAERGQDFDLEADRPVVPEHLYALLERQILPAVKCFGFMGVEPLPRIGVIAPWSRDNGGNVPIRYAGPIFADRRSDELASILDTAFTNAKNGEVPMTLGHVPIPMFSKSLCAIARAVECSTIAHRRFSNHFAGESLRFVFHPEYNHAELFVSRELSQAIYKGMCWFMSGN